MDLRWLQAAKYIKLNGFKVTLIKLAMTGAVLFIQRKKENGLFGMAPNVVLTIDPISRKELRFLKVNKWKHIGMKTLHANLLSHIYLLRPVYVCSSSKSIRWQDVTSYWFCTPVMASRRYIKKYFKVLENVLFPLLNLNLLVDLISH